MRLKMSPAVFVIRIKCGETEQKAMDIFFFATNEKLWIKNRKITILNKRGPKA